MEVKFILYLIFVVLYSSSSFCQNTALVIIDMQPYFSDYKNRLSDPDNQKKLKDITDRQIHLIKLAKEKNLPIALVEYRGCGSTCDILVKEIGDYQNVEQIVKESDGAFAPGGGTKKQLNEFLKRQKVSQLLVTGANGGACVRCTIEGALENGYAVRADPHAIADFTFKEFEYPYYYSEGEVRSELVNSENKFAEVKNPSDFDSIIKNSKKNTLGAKPLKNSEGSSKLRPHGNMTCLKIKLESLLLDRFPY